MPPQRRMHHSDAFAAQCVNRIHKTTTITELVMKRPTLRRGLEAARGSFDREAVVSFEPGPTLFSTGRVEGRSTGRAAIVAGEGAYGFAGGEYGFERVVGAVSASSSDKSRLSSSPRSKAAINSLACET